MRVEPGMALPPLRIASVRPETMRIWAPILRDPNPIHLDREAVLAKGLGDRRINQGPISVAWVIDMLLAAFPGGRIATLASRFVDNVYEADALVATGAVTAVETGPAGLRVACRFALAAEGRGDVLTGTACIAIPQGEA
jgi:3-hydroxybutyryl-CoA dehydratase